MANSPDELEILGCRIKIDFPEDLLKQSKSSTMEYRFKMAGMLAAEALEKEFTINHIVYCGSGAYLAGDKGLCIEPI